MWAGLSVTSSPLFHLVSAKWLNFGLWNSLLRWLTHMDGKLVLLVVSQSPHFPPEGLSTGSLGFFMAWGLDHKGKIPKRTFLFPSLSSCIAHFQHATRLPRCKREIVPYLLMERVFKSPYKKSLWDGRNCAILGKYTLPQSTFWTKTHIPPTCKYTYLLLQDP